MKEIKTFKEFIKKLDEENRTEESIHENLNMKEEELEQLMQIEKLDDFITKLDNKNQTEFQKGILVGLYTSFWTILNNTNNMDEVMEKEYTRECRRLYG